MKALSILLTLFSILNIANTINGEKFIDNVSKAYDEYTIVLDEETSFGDCALVYGTYKNNKYICCYLFLENVSEASYLRIKLDDDVTTYVSDSNVIEGYGLKIKKQSQVSFYFYSNEQEILIKEYSIDELNNLLEINKIDGNGKGKFPSNKKEVTFEDKLITTILIVASINLALVIVVIVLYVKRVGKFNKTTPKDPEYYPIKTYIDTTGYEVDNNEQTSEDKNESNELTEEQKKEIMDRLFDEFRCGDISEEELNKRLKNLWWKEK